MPTGGCNTVLESIPGHADFVMLLIAAGYLALFFLPGIS